MIDPENYDLIDAKKATVIMTRIDASPFSKLLGMRYQEIRKDYARMILPYRAELNQPAGIVHGGAIASLIDTVVVGAILSGLEDLRRQFVTVDMHIHYTSAAIEENLIATGYVRKNGRTMMFLAVEVYGEKTQKLIAHGELGYLFR